MSGSVRCFQLGGENNRPFTFLEIRFGLDLDTRLECLALAAGNAKSHPVAVEGRHKDAISFLTELEEGFEVTQVQPEPHHTLFPRTPNEGERIRFLTTKLFSRGEPAAVLFSFFYFYFCNLGDGNADGRTCFGFRGSFIYQGWAKPFGLVTMKLLIYHVSEHWDDNFVRPLWGRIFDESNEHITSHRALHLDVPVDGSSLYTYSVRRRQSKVLSIRVYVSTV